MINPQRVIKNAAIIVLNFNGSALLKQHLASIVAAAESTNVPTRVIVADNGSVDESEAIVKQHKNVEWLPFTKNLGFGRGNNQAVKDTEVDVVVLLNNDVHVDKKFLDPLYEALSDSTVFAASSRQQVKAHAGSYYAGGSIAEWHRGLLRHRPVEEVLGAQDHPVKTFYADAGAAAYDRTKFLALGGFSPVFPFYWEDADLSFRAWKNGWVSVMVPESQVVHQHESTIDKIAKKWRKQALGWRGIWLFTWRGIDEPSLLLSHLAWVPFHIFYALVRGQWYRLYGLLIALPSLTHRIPRTKQSKSTKAIIAEARP